MCDIEHNNRLLNLIGEGNLYTHEEAYVTIVSYIQILADDTDIFYVLASCLCHHEKV